MDTEDFIVSRREILERLEERRKRDYTSYPFRIAEEYGIRLPSWARLALSFVTSGGLLSKFLEVGLPLALPFLVKRQIPSWGRLVQRFFSPKY
jgi:hypothetical protein